VTLRVTTLKGGTVGRYYTEQLPSYYLDGGEPPGVWWGRGAVRLGLVGEIDDEAFLAVMAGRDPETGEDLGRRFGEGSVRGFDATFSAPKSVSVLFGVGDPQLRRHVTGAHDRAVDAVLGWVESQAHTRMRRRGHVVCVDAEGIVVGVFRQHTSRRLDPQLHTHAVIANRVMSPDGRWLALDARTLKLDQRTLSGLYHATLRTELTRRLGVRWHQPVNGIAEITDIDPAVLAEFSQRTGDVERRVGEKLARFRADLEREPTRREQWRLEREAVVDSRPGKDHTRPPGELHHAWRARLRALGVEPAELVASMIGRQRRRLGITPETAAAMVDQAIAALTERQSTWRPAELVRELAAQVPTTATDDPDQLVGFLQRLADETAVTHCVDLSQPVPAGVEVRRDGRPVTEAAVHRALTTQAILDQEERLVEWAEKRRSLSDPVFEVTVRRTGIADHQGLSRGQVEACAAVAGLAPLELIVGPAGTGKTTALVPAVDELQAQGRAVFGVASTAAAAEVLATETAMSADTLDKLLHEHTRPDRPPGLGFDLPVGSTVIVDEAGTVSTPKLAELAGLAEQRAWRVVLVGDPRQFSAVGRGGMFAHLIDTHGAIELDQVHRFANRWEREASLRLRNGDPGVLVEYDRRGRLHDGTRPDMETSILDAWSQARSRGESVALMANTVDTVTRLNQAAQQIRVRNGELDPGAPGVDVGGQRLLVGDEVVTRRNDRTLRTDRGVMIKNRDHWTIHAIHADRSVSLTGRTGTVRAPAGYVGEHVELGYAQTSRATQGRTVDTGLLLVDAPTDSRGVYTPMTRGRNANHAYVVTDENQAAVDVLTEAVARDWIDQPAITRRTQLESRHQDPPRWPSLHTDQQSRPDATPEHGLGREPAHADGAGDNPSAQDQRIERLVEQQLKAIQQRRSIDRNLNRSDHGIGR
jgi:conjugative relaxase-like TrwC/TraI family protein